MNHPQLSILIPAAGASKRLGQTKQLVRYKSVTLIQNAVNIASSINPCEVIVITGHKASSVKNAVDQTPVHWVHNSNWSDGMGSSIAAGAAVVSHASCAVMILLCDQWRLETSDLRLMAETWQSNPERIICARANEQNMPPVIFPIDFLSQLQALEGENGARDILGDKPEMLIPVPLKNALFDLDTTAGLSRLKSYDL
jgi:molybdenum cofactor cytidylyltransferase